VPPVLYAHVPAGLINHAKRRRLPEQTLAFFQGKLNLHIPYEYSFGIRQGLYKAFRSKPSILVREGHEANKERYFEHMSGSKFCIAAAGFGFSTRAYEAATAGCVPLIMQDGIEQAFEDVLPWGLFSRSAHEQLPLGDQHSRHDASRCAAESSGPNAQHALLRLAAVPLAETRPRSNVSAAWSARSAQI